jgi:excisionase family DNA binding protein
MDQATGQSMEQKYLSARQAEEYAHLSRWTLMRANARGELPVIRVGSAVRFSVEDLDSFMQARRS